MNPASIESAVQALTRIRQNFETLDQFESEAQPQSLQDAYAIQDAFVQATPERVIGWKVGCTSRMAQEMSETDEPFYGRMFDSLSWSGSVAIAPKSVFAPIVEPEIAFRLGSDLPVRESAYGVDEVLDAIDGMLPAIELVDCRYSHGWPIKIIPTVADNGVHAGFISGQEIDDWRSIERDKIEVRVSVDGKFVVDGSGANALDDPVNGLVWLVNRLIVQGKGLQAGEYVTTGNIAGKPVFAKPGEQVVCDFGDFGQVAVEFSVS